jgi:NitT/TauT family transport system substrate-binding protein
MPQGHDAMCIRGSSTPRVALALLAWLVLSTGPTVAFAETIKLAVPQRGIWESMIPLLGEKAGLFKKENIEIEPLFTRGGSETVQAVLAGSVDAAISNGLLGTIGGFVKGAPLRVIGASTTGTPEAFWYVRADSPIKSVKDFGGKKIGFSRPGSSTHLMMLSAFDYFKVKGDLVSCGGIPGCYTQTMSKQIDAGWSVPPFRLDDIKSGAIRIVTVRVDVTSAQTLEKKRDLLVRFNRALQASLDYSYSSDKALEDYAKETKITKERAREVRDVYYPKVAMQKTEIRGMDIAMKQALEFKFISKPMKPEDVKGMMAILK